jgi:hypothetical protein
MIVAMEDTTVMAGNLNNKDAWDDICLNPHESHMELGREEGRQAALQAGFKDGYSLGRTKGIEFGMELGFIRGFLNTLEKHLQWEQQQRQQQSSLIIMGGGGGEPAAARAAVQQRIQRGAHDLRRAIEDFPTPDAMFVASSTMNDDDDDERNNNCADSETNNATQDVMGALQRIRAKFKVLTVQLKIPHYSLHQIMADAVARVDEQKRTFHVAGATTSNASGSGEKVLTVNNESQGESSEW